MPLYESAVIGQEIFRCALFANSVGLIYNVLIMTLTQKIIANVYADDRIIKGIVYECDPETDFETALREICYSLDIPTPVVLNRHSRRYSDFNFTRFLPDDFVEDVIFDALNIENAYKKETDHPLDDY